MTQIVLCPNCREASLAGLSCAACGFQAVEIDGCLDLRLDRTADTLLDIEGYDAAHGVSDAPSLQLYDVYRSALSERGIEMGNGPGDRVWVKEPDHVSRAEPGVRGDPLW